MRTKIRYAIVGLGHIAQTAVIPAFQHAKNSELAAFLSNDPEKLKKLGRKYGVAQTFSYDDFEKCLSSGEVDAVYIALPNNMHQEYVERAADLGVHVLCEKPMALTEEACEAMIRRTEENNVKLMIAYRLHFERANMEAVEIARSGRLGDLRIFNSTFTMQVRDADNIRLDREKSGGTLFDIGIYCINAARYLFRDEPTEVMAYSVNGGDKRFTDVDEMTSAILKFPKDRVAAFTCSFGASAVSRYELLGTKGNLTVDSAYEYTGPVTHHLTIDGKTRSRTFPGHDQFGPELVYFSDCILRDRHPEPSGLEGLADVRIINALYESSKTGGRVHVRPVAPHARPGLSQAIRLPAISVPKTVHVTGPKESHAAR